MSAERALDRSAKERVVGGGPRLDVAEWIALIQIHRANKGAVLAPDHPDVIAASPVLARLASARGAARDGAQLRSPEGLARRLSMLRRLAHGNRTRVPAYALAAWLRFEEEPAASEALAASILRPVYDLASFPTPQSYEVHIAAPSRGPAPFEGTSTVERAGGPEYVYLMILDGARPAGAPTVEHLYAKIGRSSDPARREAELNGGFPPGLGLGWRCHYHIGPVPAAEAHRLEQAILAALAVRGMTLGGEFCVASSSELRMVVKEAAAHLAVGPLPLLAAAANVLPGKGVRGAD